MGGGERGERERQEDERAERQVVFSCRSCHLHKVLCALRGVVQCDRQNARRLQYFHRVETAVVDTAAALLL